ncbi:diguanylate cyclase [Alloacidobacterium dinghuense]|uniref:diguanylate cyclase n=1 Tax=Alloacidobacterium dinghuense TaxID=2763107 RepID=A0A7G8BPC1_9BACT|nr:sensor domain-containing diguanylate cyclase [Alloacidobacterium dinghuense]QNI34391.1 diguanylate cyclase [Alloacidobacterium dinghuense]
MHVFEGSLSFMAFPVVAFTRKDGQKLSMRRLAVLALILASLSTTTSLLNLQSWHSGGITILWPSNGFLAGALLCVRRRHWPAYLAVGFLVDLGINLSLATPSWVAVYLALCNMVEALLAGTLLYRTIAPNPDLTQRKQLTRFLLYGVVVAPAVASLMATLVFGRQGRHIMSHIHTFQWWFTADALGMAVMIPLYLSFARRKLFLGRSWWEIVGVFALLCGSAVAVFWQTQAPLLFALLLGLLMIGVRLGLAGSALGLLVVSIIGGFFTTAGRGPLALMQNVSLTTRELTLQAFIAFSMLMLYILEVLRAEGYRLQEGLRVSEARFRLLAVSSRDAILLVNLEAKVMYASPAVTEMLGWETEQTLGLSYREAFHPEDITVAESVFKDTREGRHPGMFQFRCRKKDGSYLWMEASLRLYRDSSANDATGFVVVMRDISLRKAAEDELQRAFRMVEALASVDGLTGIANRRRFDEVLQSEWRRAQRDRTPCSVLLMDLDHFKNYNDIYGHIPGDRCLRQMAEAATQVSRRPADLVARYGGEEFAVILPDTSCEGAIAIAEEVRSAVEQLQVPHSGNPHGIVTVSIGCATQVPPVDGDLSELLKAADSALYVAKSLGRNRVDAALPVLLP